MDLRRLTYFLAVAEHGSMAKAAGALDVSQPTLSQQIRALESDLASVLFDRTGRGMQLTEPGRLLRDHARRLLANAEAARTALAELEGGMSGTLRFGVIHTYSTAFLPKIISAFSERFPGVSLNVEEATAIGIEDAIVAGTLDLGLAFAPPQHTDLGVDVLFEERLVLVGAKGGAFSSRRSISLAALQQIPLALLTRAFATRRILDAAVGANDKLDIRVEMNSVEALIELAKGGSFPTVLADRSFGSRTDIDIVPIGPPWIRRSGALLWDAHRYQTAAARAFMAVVRRQIRQKPAR
jgi:DNA-binding transcriptional LysR family regulator